MKPADPPELRRILELWAEGLASVDIAHELGMTKNAVLGRIWRYRRRGLADAPAMRIHAKSTTPKPRKNCVRPPVLKQSAPRQPIVKPLVISGDVDKRRKERRSQNQWAPVPRREVVQAIAPKPVTNWAARLVEPVPADAVLFAERRMGFQCAWIFTDTSKPPAMCCGHATMSGSEYCPDHYARTWAPSQPRRAA